MPFAAVTFVLAGVASMGLPGFSGFVAELQVLIGAWQAFPTAGVVAGVGIVIGVAYTLRAMQRAFFTDVVGAGRDDAARVGGDARVPASPGQGPGANRTRTPSDRFHCRNGSGRCCCWERLGGLASIRGCCST